MVTLLNSVNPYLKIYVPGEDGYRQFQGGKLVIDSKDPGYKTVMEVARNSPSIIVLQGEGTCTACGDKFKGDDAAAELERHTKDVHFEVWVAGQRAAAEDVIQSEIKRRASVFCDACSPAQEFPTEDALLEHLHLLHLAAPADGGDGGDGGSTTGGVDPTIPAATG